MLTVRETSVVEFVNTLISEAIKHKASDIHIEPFANSCRIRFRRDGLLSEVKTIQSALAKQIMIRLKVMGLLNISESRLPQDGRIHFMQETPIDIRISTCPTHHGEKIVLRLLDASCIQFDVTSIGLNNTQATLLRQKLSLPQGLILVTGPTGSGKTITLYAMLRWLNQIEKNIMTAEDPIEIELNGINQVAVNHKIRLDFATIIRAFLRQDPDIIMVGEIRDKETATIAIQAAQTGHLVLSTLHASDASEVLSRFQTLGVNHQDFTAISLIISQRLVRTLCTVCYGKDKTDCGHCYDGFQGRTGIFELLDLSNQTSNAVEAKHSHDNLWEAGLEKIKLGVTTYSELTRVLGKQTTGCQPSLA